MNIAMMVRSYIPVPRPRDMIYAPIDLAVDIAQGLTKKGHRVDVYAPIGSKLEKVNIKTCNLRAFVNNYEDLKKLISDPGIQTRYVPHLWDEYMVSEMFKLAKSGEYDLLHFHHPETALAMARLNKNIPVVYTLHDPVYDWYREVFELYESKNQHFISISNNQRRDAPDLAYARTIYNGIDLKQYPFSAEHDDYLLISGRLVPEKGVKEAVQIAMKTKNRLLIIGPTYPDSQGYFDQYVKPYLSDQILYLGYVEKEQLPIYYQKAKAVITPIQWEEPFGLTTIEAMASGTPVISLRRGAAPEIIENGKNGFVVDSIAEMCEAVENIKQIDRQMCRKRVQKMFSSDKMVDGYEEAYMTVLNKHKSQTPLLTPIKLRKARQRVKTAVRKKLRNPSK